MYLPINLSNFCKFTVGILSQCSTYLLSCVPGECIIHASRGSKGKYFILSQRSSMEGYDFLDKKLDWLSDPKSHIYAMIRPSILYSSTYANERKSTQGFIENRSL